MFIAVGLWAYIEKNRFHHTEVESIYDVIFDVSIVIIVVGCIVFLVAFTGCVGALRENICLLKFVSGFCFFWMLTQALFTQDAKKKKKKKKKNGKNIKVLWIFF